MTVMEDASMNTNLHAAFKREIARIKSGLQRIDLADTNARQGLARRYEFFSQSLHHHHQGEDRYLTGTVRSSADPAEVEVLDQMESEHQTMLATLNLLDEQFTSLSAESDKAAISDNFDLLLSSLSQHCDHEEAVGVPIVQKYLTEDAYKEFMQYNRKAPNASLVFPWVCDGADPAVASQTWGVLPGPVRLIVKPMMSRKYQRFTADCGV